MAIACWVGGRNLIMYMHLGQLAEITQVLLNLRNTYAKKKGGMIPAVINACFFVSFTIFRVICGAYYIVILQNINIKVDLLSDYNKASDVNWKQATKL